MSAIFAPVKKSQNMACCGVLGQIRAARPALENARRPYEGRIAAHGSGG